MVFLHQQEPLAVERGIGEKNAAQVSSESVHWLQLSCLACLWRAQLILVLHAGVLHARQL